MDHGSFWSQLGSEIRRGSRADPERIKRTSADHRRGKEKTKKNIKEMERCRKEIELIKSGIYLDSMERMN